MTKKFNILAPTRYPWYFHGPKKSKHNLSIRNFLPLNKISPKIEGLTIFNPFPFRHFDLIHAFNRIPIGTTPFIIGFESHLPRAFGLEDTAYFAFLSRMLTSKRCKGIIAISEYAKRAFLHQHENKPWRDELVAKLSLRFPNFPIPSGPDEFDAKPGDPIKLFFVGNHFGRKGGAVAVRLAELANQRNFPLEIDIVSSMEIGNQSWIGPTRLGYFDPYLQLMHSLPNIRYHGTLPNKEVLAHIRKAHFMLLPTFSDTFGFSTLETMVNSTPLIGTTQGALPEVIEDGVNGFLLPLERNALGEWKYAERQDRDTQSYEIFFQNETDRLAEEAYGRIERLMGSPQAYAAMRVKTRATAEAVFSSDASDILWDKYYDEVLLK